MSNGVTGVIGDLLNTIHGTISTFLGGGGVMTGVIKPISMADATKLIEAGMTMAQLTALGYVIVS